MDSSIYENMQIFAQNIKIMKCMHIIMRDWFKPHI